MKACYRYMLKRKRTLQSKESCRTLNPQIGAEDVDFHVRFIPCGQNGLCL